MSSPFGTVLASISRHRGVLGAFVVSERDGIAVESLVQIGVDTDAVAALAASLYRKARLAAAAAGYGASSFVHLEGQRGRICATGSGDLVLVAIAESRVNFGLLRLEMLRASKGLA